MRKLILIAAIAFATASPWYANLSLASSELSSTVVEQPKASVKNDRVVRTERSERHSAHRQRRWAGSPFSRYFGGGFGRSFGFSYYRGGGC